MLTLVREIEILREENLKLKDQLDRKKVEWKFYKQFEKMAYQMSKQLRFMTGSNSEAISSRCQSLVDQYEELIADRKSSRDVKPPKLVDKEDYVKFCLWYRTETLSDTEWTAPTIEDVEEFRNLKS